MATQKENNIKTIFVDCFDTIVFRNISKKDVFKKWAQELSAKYNIPWKTIYSKYNKTNFNLCFKKLFTTLTLQENFEIVLDKLYQKLSKKFTNLQKEDFISSATKIYFQKELDCFGINKQMVDFLKQQKLEGKKIYLVSDFYCKSDVISKWFENLKIKEIFDDIFSSSDFNKEKATTKLYKKLLMQLQLNPQEVKMHGDNLWSDVMMAKACHLNAKRIKIANKGEKNEN